METSPRTFTKLLVKILGILEKVGIVLSFLGIVFKMMHWTGGNEFLLIGMATLAIALFQTSFLPPAQPNHYLIGVVSKVGYIASAVGVIGILFKLLHFNGANEILLISVMSLAVVVVMTGILTLRSNEALNALRPMLFRGVPILLACLYILYQLYR